MFLLGKCAITTAFGSLYIITAEIYPTPFRQTLMGICSMLGRIGSMSAPQMPVLVRMLKRLVTVKNISYFFNFFIFLGDNLEYFTNINIQFNINNGRITITYFT